MVRIAIQADTASKELKRTSGRGARLKRGGRRRRKKTREKRGQTDQRLGRVEGKNTISTTAAKENVSN